MTPVVLDQNALLKAGITAALIVTGVFVSGYTIGLRSAESETGVDLNETIVLALPKPVHADLSGIESLAQRVPIAGAEIGIDRPDSIVDTIEQPPDTGVDQAERQLASVITQSTNAFEASELSHTSVGPALHETIEHQPAKSSDDVTVTALDAIPMVNTAGQKQHVPAVAPTSRAGIQSSAAGILDTATADEARYTIQVGVFSNTNNAIRKMSELESQQLSAYVNEYKNKSNQPRFNVRFGYFKDKSSATAALSRFEQDLAGSGYVTRIRRH